MLVKIKLIIASFLIIAGLNVHSVAMLALKSLPIMENMFLLVICTLQTAFTSMVMRPMVNSVHAVHSAGQHLYRAQPHLDGSSVPMKLTLCTHYEVLNGREKLTFTVGAVGQVTTENFFHVGQNKSLCKI